MRVFVFFPEMFEIGEELIFGINNIKIKIEIILANGAKVSRMAWNKLNQQLVNTLNFKKYLFILGRNY